MATYNYMADTTPCQTDKSNRSHLEENLISNDVNESLISSETSWRDVDHTPKKAANYNHEDKYNYEYNRPITNERSKTDMDENETGICHISQPPAIHLSTSCDTLLTPLIIETPYSQRQRKPIAYFNDSNNNVNYDDRKLKDVDSSNSWKWLTIDADVILQDISLASLVPSSPLSETETNNERSDYKLFDIDLKTSKRNNKKTFFHFSDRNIIESNNNHHHKWPFHFIFISFKQFVCYILQILSQFKIIQTCQDMTQCMISWYLFALIWCIQLPYHVSRYIISLPYHITLWCLEFMVDVFTLLMTQLLGYGRPKSTSTSTSVTCTSTTSDGAGGGEVYRH